MLTISGAGAADAGSYDVVVSNACGTATSDPAGLTIEAGPSISDQPDPLSICAGGNAMFSVTAAGGGTLAYQWRKGGTNLADGPSAGGGTISGATTSTLTITGAGVADAGSYDVVVSNACGMATSAAAVLVVNTAPTITGQPANQTVTEGGSAAFSVTANGSGTLAYQWRRGTTNLANGGNISGATTASLTINPVSLADAATNYNCVVSNACGSATSNNAR